MLLLPIGLLLATGAVAQSRHDDSAGAGTPACNGPLPRPISAQAMTRASQSPRGYQHSRGATGVAYFAWRETREEQNDDSARRIGGIPSR